MKLKIMIVAKGDLRHRLFLRMAQIALGDHWVATCIHTPDGSDNFGDSRSKFRKYVVRNTRYLLKPFKQMMGPRSVDLCMKSMLGLDPLPDSEIPNLFISANLNSERALNQLRSLNPDLILIFGAQILKGDWVTLARLGTLNMHYGMLPWYRSGHSTQFALLHERPDRVGATIHYIDSGIDTGAIVKRCLVPPGKSSSVNELVAEVYIAGALGLIECAKASITRNSRLECFQESDTSSFYPAKFGTPDVMDGAAWRLCELQAEWPQTQRAIEKKALHRPRPWQYQLPSKAPNGVYVFLYHSLTDPANMEPWERSYVKVRTDIKRFYEQIDFLLREGFVPLPLSGAPEILRRGSPDKRYFVVTFDDGYSNIVASNSFLRTRHIRPTVFVNGSFCTGTPYYRVLAAMLKDHNGMHVLHGELNARAPHVSWSTNPQTLFNQTKYLYIDGITEKAVTAAYDKVVGPPLDLKCHLKVDELSFLEQQGWEIGSHTWEHKTMSALTESGVYEAIERNVSFLSESGLNSINYLSYPNGLARLVNAAVKHWLDDHQTMHGIFAGGGVNFVYSRTQWLRIPVANPTLDDFKRQIRQSIAASTNVFGENIAWILV